MEHCDFPESSADDDPAFSEPWSDEFTSASGTGWRSSGISDRGSDPRKAGASGKRRVCTSGRNGTFSLPDGICDV